MDQVKKTKIRNIVSKYRNKSSSDLSKDFSYESKVSNTVNSSRPSHLQDKKAELNLIKEESENDHNHNNSLFNSNFYEKLKENQIDYFETYSKTNLEKMLKASSLSSHDVNSLANNNNNQDKEIRNTLQSNPNTLNNSNNYYNNSLNFTLNKNTNEKLNGKTLANVKGGSANLISFPPQINNNNFNSANTLDGFNFDSENTCKDMLEQVKKVVEYNTNFINRNNAGNENKIGNDFNALSDQRQEGNNNHNNYRTSNSLYSNSNNNFNNNMNNFGIENVSPLAIGNNRDNTLSSFNNSNKLLNKNRTEKLDFDLQGKLKLDSIENNPFKNPVNSNYTNFLNYGININHNYSNYALYTKNTTSADQVNNIMVTGGNPFKNNNSNITNNNQSNLEINSFNAGISTGNFNNPESSQYSDISVIDKSLNNSKINLQQHNKASRETRLSNINLLQDYKLSLDGKINNLKKIINQKMGYNKFKNLRNEVFVNILNYFNTYDIYAVMNMNSYIKHKILAVLTDYSRVICNEFEKKFNKNFLLKNSQILIMNVKRNRKLYSKINLVLKFQLTDANLKNKSVILGYLNKYYGEADCLKNFFRFDVRGPGPISFWVMREYTSFHQDELNKAYFQHIMQFCLNDIAEININLFTDKGIIDLKSFKWLNLNVDKIPQFNFLEFSNDHNKLREVLDFDLSRFCEMEIMKNKWTDLVHNENYENIIKKIKFLFEPNFIIQKVLWDDVGYHLFKIFLIAAEKGKLNSSSEVGIKISIKDSNEPLTNEIKKNCLLFDGKDQIQLRIGDILIFYISKNK